MQPDPFWGMAAQRDSAKTHQVGPRLKVWTTDKNGRSAKDGVSERPRWGTIQKEVS